MDERSTVSISSVFKLGTVGNGNGTHDRASINVKTRKFMAHRSRASGVVNLRIEQRTRWGFSIHPWIRGEDSSGITNEARFEGDSLFFNANRIFALKFPLQKFRISINRF